MDFEFNWNGPAVIDEVEARLVRQMNDLGHQVVDIAQLYAPKRTGFLASSIHAETDPATLTLTILVDAPYGIFVEYGTRYMSPQPYLRPALNTVGPIYGIDLVMAFDATPEIHAPLLAHGAGFYLPNTLSTSQVEHVRKNLLPTSKRHHISNVSRAQLRVGHRPGRRRRNP